MEKDKKNRVAADQKDHNTTSNRKKIKPLQRLDGPPTHELSCDIDTGICGPVKPKKAGEK